MVSAMPSRGIPEDVPATNTALASHPFANTMPLLDASTDVLPPILPGKRSYGPDDQPPPTSLPNTTDWANNHGPAPKKKRVIHALPRTVGSAAGTYAFPTSQAHRGRDASPQSALHAMRTGVSMPPSNNDFASGRLPQGSAYSVPMKQPDALYATSPDPSASIDPGNFRSDLALSRPLPYSDPLGGIPPGTAGPSFLPANMGQGPSMAPSAHGGYLGGGSRTSGRGRRVSTCDDSFVIAAETGARAQCAVDNASGDGVFETYDIGISIVQSSKLYANQRRSNRLLPGGSDSTTAACYMIGGTPDSVLSPLMARVSPCDPREERCKAVERVLKDKTRGAICALNGDNPREARADNLAAVRICEVVADILVAFSARKLIESRKQLFETVQRQEEKLKELEAEVAKYKNECERWRKAAGEDESGPQRETGGVGSASVEERVGGLGNNGRGVEDGTEGRDGVEEHKVVS